MKAFARNLAVSIGVCYATPIVVMAIVFGFASLLRATSDQYSFPRDAVSWTVAAALIGIAISYLVDSRFPSLWALIPTTFFAITLNTMRSKPWLEVIFGYGAPVLAAPAAAALFRVKRHHSDDKNVLLNSTEGLPKPKA